MSSLRHKPYPSSLRSALSRIARVVGDLKNLSGTISILFIPHDPSPLPLQTLPKLHLNRGALAFLRKYPKIFQVCYNQSKSQPFCKLTEQAVRIAREEAMAIDKLKPLAIERLVRLLAMSASRSLPLRAVFKVWRELGLPDDFEDSVISQNPNLFSVCDGIEPNTHVVKLVCGFPIHNFSAHVENWRKNECESSNIDDELGIRFGFKHGFPPGMRLSKDFRRRVKEWQRLAYVGPYESIGGGSDGKKLSRGGMKGLEKRAVGIVHEFLSLTVEKMVEVERISHFRKWFGIDLNIRDLFLDHPGIFYLSTKGNMHMVFLREAYERGCLIEPNPVYVARRKLLDLVILGRRGMFLEDGDVRTVREPQEAGFRAGEGD
ncbi:hypothetical protein Scep_026640 [Stephania cephalantha]|uniref:PORR domain-containing protein n=1 Tax=Stephania cephalantha TaxID=152367 RepID=A0AAP0EKK1_9MAGN